MAGHGGDRADSLVRGFQPPGPASRRLLVYLFSNGRWVTWGQSAGAHALVLLDVCVDALNIRGVTKLQST